MRTLTLLTFVFLAAACVDTTQAPETHVTTTSGEESPISSAAMAQWARSCALCHVRGEGGAPMLGDTEAWESRIAQGADVLLAHTLEGLNNMPPLGYCMDCEEEDFRQIIAFLSGSGRGTDR